MNFRPLMLVEVLLIGSSVMLTAGAFAQTTVAINATQAEVEIWKERAVSGPYKEGWDIIKSRADAFVSNPESRWQGKTTNACYSQRSDGEIERTRDRGLRDAGFAYLVTGATSYRNAARNALLSQAAVPGTDFTNATKWCSPTSDSTGVANWLRRLVYGYSYIRDTITASERTTLDNWFLGGGRFFEAAVHARIKSRFPDRFTNAYSTCASDSLCPGKSNGLLYFGGPTTYEFSQAWANQPAARTAMFAAVGVVVNDTNLKDRAKRFVEEWLKFAVWPNGVIFDQHRWDTSPVNPQVGYSYEGTAIGSIVSIADHLARAGDTELYEFSTSEGMFGTQGGPKSLLKVLQHFAGLTNGTVLRYASNTATTNPDLLIDDAGPSDQRIIYLSLAPANVYYRNPDVKTAYMTPLPSRWKSGGYDSRGGDWGSYPDVLFMFGQQENAVWPYPTGQADTSPPAAPTNLLVAPSGS